METGYNGWANWETWNVALWISNDEGLYNLALGCRGDRPYDRFVDDLRDAAITETPDKVAYNDSGLDIKRLDAMFEEMRD